MTRTDGDVLTVIAGFDTPSANNTIQTPLGVGPEDEGLEHRGGGPVNYTDYTMRAIHQEPPSSVDPVELLAELMPIGDETE